MKEVTGNLYQLENKKNFFKSKIKEIEKNILEFGESLSKLKKQYTYDDIDYKRINKVKFLFNQSIDEDYTCQREALLFLLIKKFYSI